MLSSNDVAVGATVFGQLRIENHGTDDSPISSIELYWADPASGFAALPARLIGSWNAVIPGATVGAGEGELVENFSWTPSVGGHLVLLARIANDSSPPSPCSPQAYDSSAPESDPQSAVRDVQVTAASPP